MYDVIIIGMGISGISAAIYAKRNNLNVLVLEKDTPGGLLNKINVVDNYPGFKSISGPDLSYNLFEQFNANNIEYKLEEVMNVKVEEDKKIVTTSKDVYKSKYVIIASGRVARRLGIKNEDNLIGRGISNCALCDGNLYKGKDIAVVGGGNSALEETIYLSNLVNKIYLIHRNNTFAAEDTLVNIVKEKDNVEIIYNANIKEIKDENGILSSIVLDNDRELEISGLFEYIGYVPGNNFLGNLDICGSSGYIDIDNNYETKIDGIYAVGDSVNKPYYQLILAANDGARAAMDIIKKNNNRK